MIPNNKFFISLSFVCIATLLSLFFIQFVGAEIIALDTTPPVLSNVHAINIIGPGAQIGWNTDDPSDSRVKYGTSSGNYTFFSDSRCDGGGYVTTHCVNLTGLSANTVYYYKVESKNASNLDSHSIEYQFTSAAGEPSPTSSPSPTPSPSPGPSPSPEPGDTTPPVLSDVHARNIIGPGAQIGWTTDDPSDSRVTYGISSGSYTFFSDSRCDGGGYVTTHCVNLTGLSANTVYYYKVESKNASNLDSHSSEYQFTSAANTTTTNTVAGAEKISKITGTVRDSLGNALTGIDTRVFANSEVGVWQEGLFDRATGQYVLNVASGTWYVGYEIDQKSGYLSLRASDVKVVVGEGAVVQKDFVALKAEAKIQGHVTDPFGMAIGHVFIGVESIGASAESDATGFYSIGVPAGSYVVKSFARPELGFINSDEKSITVRDGETVTVDLQLRKADLSITGKVLFNNVPQANAFVWGWSEYGGYQESLSKSDGSFQLPVSSFAVWRIAGGSKGDGEFLKSEEIAVSMESTSVVRNIDLARVAVFPSAEFSTTYASTPTVVKVEDGTVVSAPANSIATTGSITLSVTPDPRAPSQGELKVVGIAYEIEARNELGQQITKFSGEITVSIPYKEEDVLSLGSREEDLGMSFWNEAVGTWETLANSIVNKDTNTVTAVVDHLTRFALVVAADITPPSAPSQVTATALGGGKIQLQWVAPVSDYRHAKLYRSQQAGQLGKIIAVEVAGNGFIDEKDIADKIVYYYTVRAIDGAGNESLNVAQAVVQAQGGAVAQGAQGTAGLPPGQAVRVKLSRNLSFGSSGDDVRILQAFLVKENVYPEGLVTGLFASLTRQAVIRFQEKYASSILHQFTLSRGTGFVGPATRKKINELLKY